MEGLSALAWRGRDGAESGQERTRPKVPQPGRTRGILEDKMVCDKCQKREGKPFNVHYGKQLSYQQSQVAGSQSIKTEATYRVGGNTQVYFCTSCIRKRRLGFFGIALAVMVVAIVIAGLSGGGTLGLVCGLAFFISLGATLRMVATGHRGFAEHWAQDLKRDALLKQGWNSLWSDEQDARMKLTKAILS